ncbi:DNA/RNA polymerase [Pseudovirgaria hyperparasitica]|uniref:DNA/RNA polymerase n=1 Tax=Pseudovirgaria hyperparasitica TaxID=470096 RepID=A0A6A6WJF8_9PEZI|nr:DNA/RNA polymerase [Pseudovirgaria hyperparasitica]KAF2762375.1 DNA/RNA polymerase [Pseudovirgaria hyperparasitica]
MEVPLARLPTRPYDSSVILHFDYDCFYASVFEAENPALRSLPLAVQQKQIIVTCNYEARRRGLHKLQLVTDAKRTCPDVIIVLGEDLTRFRNASKTLYNFLRSFSWNGKVERLGFDEVFLDVTDLIRFNVDLLNSQHLQNSFFCLDRSDPTAGFNFDATSVTGHTHGIESRGISSPNPNHYSNPDEALRLRLVLGSHLAQFLRLQLEERHNYTSTVGISTSKLLAKLVGNLHKPKSQTTLIPPYTSEGNDENSVTSFIDGHEVGKIPGIGFKLAQKLRHLVLGRPADLNNGLVYGDTKAHVSVKDVRTYPNMCPELLENLLSGPGAPKGIGIKVWNLVNGIDESDISQARDVPRQISLEDSYLRLDTYSQVLEELRMLSVSLLDRMHIDLMEDETGIYPESELMEIPAPKRWIAFPKSLRLTTRPRPPQNPDGSRNRSFARISRSQPLPNFVFNNNERSDVTAERLVAEALIPLFRRLHPEKSGWNLSLINIAVTDIVEAAGNTKDAAGRDISKMFKQQDTVLRQWRLKDTDGPGDNRDSPQPSPGNYSMRHPTEVGASPGSHGSLTINVTSPQRKMSTATTDQQSGLRGSEDCILLSSQSTIHDSNTDMRKSIEDTGWVSDEDTISSLACPICGAMMPAFAMQAHERYHDMGD